MAPEGIFKNPNYSLIKEKLETCFNTTDSNHSSVLNASVYVFDALSCWDPTPAGATAYQKCPDFVVGFDGTRYSYKTCTEFGIWAKHPLGTKPWTNYTSCVDMEDLKFRNLVNNIYLIGYTTSVLTLLCSIMLFKYFKSLKCTRVWIHLNLFGSFAVNNALWIAWHLYVVKDVTVVQENPIWCQLLHIVMHYFMASNYTWMFSESLHLHISLVVVFVREDVAIKWFKIIGWGVPLVDILIYAISRFASQSGTERCWMGDHNTFWIITGPVLISLLASLAFMINIIRVLMTKLRPTGDRNSTEAAMKAVRATIILIPLFGLHFMLIPLRPETGSKYERLYAVTAAIITSFQGAMMSLIFCFLNSEIMLACRGIFQPHTRRSDMIPLRGITVGDSSGNVRTTATRGRHHQRPANRDLLAQPSRHRALLHDSQDTADTRQDRFPRDGISRDGTSHVNISQDQRSLIPHSQSQEQEIRILEENSQDQQHVPGQERHSQDQQQKSLVQEQHSHADEEHSQEQQQQSLHDQQQHSQAHEHSDGHADQSQAQDEQTHGQERQDIAISRLALPIVGKINIEYYI